MWMTGRERALRGSAAGFRGIDVSLDDTSAGKVYWLRSRRLHCIAGGGATHMKNAGLAVAALALALTVACNKDHGSTTTTTAGGASVGTAGKAGDGVSS